MAKRNINSPAALAECEAAHRQGVTEGNGEGLAIYLSVMRDKFGKSSKALYRIWQRTEHECTAISFDGSLIADYERELRELIKQDICPYMADIVHAYKPPSQPIRYKDVLRCGRQAGQRGRLAVCNFGFPPGNTICRGICQNPSNSRI